MRHGLGRMPLLPYPRQPWGRGAGSKAIPGTRTPPPSLRAGLMGLLGPEFKYWPESRTCIIF